MKNKSIYELVGEVQLSAYQRQLDDETSESMDTFVDTVGNVGVRGHGKAYGMTLEAIAEELGLQGEYRRMNAQRAVRRSLRSMKLHWLIFIIRKRLLAEGFNEETIEAIILKEISKSADNGVSISTLLGRWING